MAFGAMRAVLLTNDPVCLSFAETALRAEGLECLVLDAATSAAEGSIGAIPRRLVVSTDDAGRARAVLRALGLDPYDG
jgi:Putative prokaryotic signal transducing protein